MKFGAGDTITELKSKALASYILYAEESRKKQITEAPIVFEFDLPSAFERYEDKTTGKELSELE